jgi:hypothetical protein
VQPGRTEQVPTRFGTLQDQQGAAQAEAQQTPCAQMPLAHWLLLEQVAVPLTWHRPVGSQVVPEQSSSVAQSVRHQPAPATHRYGAQISVGPVRQLPRPSHTLLPTTVSPSH